jgi:ferredoxin--NADP+ reductase
MFKIVDKKELSPGVFCFDIKAPRVAKKAAPGQFIVLRVNERGERVPLTIADFDRKKGTVTIIFQAVGASTELLARLEPGNSITDFVGPLGQPSHIEAGMGTIVCIGGGIGVAPVYPIARGMKQAGNKVISILGAKTKDILIFEDKMRAVSDEVIVTTDDGSYGIKGFVTTALQQLVDRGEKIDQVTAIGPGVMMRSVVEATRPLKIKTIVSLNPIMIDGTGMCGGCRVMVGDEMKFACVDGPEFDGHLVDFKSLMSRQRMYKSEEVEGHDHNCRIGLGLGGKK